MEVFRASNIPDVAGISYYSGYVASNGLVVEGKVLPVPIRYLVWNEADLEDVKRARKRMFTEMTADERFVRQQSLPARQLAKAAQLKLRSKKL